MGKKFNKFIYLLAVLVISFTTVISVDAAGQWKTESGQWTYYVENTKQKNWIKSDSEWYFLDSEGYMQTGWELEGNSWYYLNTNGVMHTGWLKEGDSWYYLNTNGVMHTGWLKEGNNWYYLNANGVMQTGWLKEGNNWYYLNANGIMQTGWLKEGNNWYYLNANGIMQTGWLKDGQNWYYLNTSGVMQTGWLKDGQNWYYLNTSGVMQTEWLKLGETWYYLNTSGAMQTGWIEDVATWYYLNSSGAMQNGWTKEEEIVKENDTEFKTIYQEDSTIPTGETKISEEGINGYEEITFSVTYVNGLETDREEVSRKTMKPVDEVIVIGTQVTKLEVETVRENEVEFITTEIEDDSLPEGEANVLQEGLVGYDEVTYSVTYVNDIEISRKEINRETIKPTVRIVRLGTQVTEVNEEIIRENEIEFSIIEQEDNSIPVGETVVSQEGVSGYDEIIFSVTYVNGEETNREEVSRKTVNPINEIIKIGTQVTEVKEETVQEQEVQFTIIEQKDDTLLAGEAEILQAGMNGYDTVVYSVTYINGEEAEREEVSRKTIEPTTEVIRIGTRVDVESIELSHTKLSITQLDTFTITATVLPENSTNKELIWSSSDGNIVTINEDGLLEAHNIGEAIIKVSDSTGTIVNEIAVTVNAPTIDFIDNLVVNLTQNDTFELPKTVQGFMSNGVVNELTIDWSGVIADTSLPGTHEFEGTVEGYDEPVKLTLIVEEYDPQLITNGYSSVTINNVSQSLNLSINNRGTKPATVDKIEIYEGDRLYTTYTTQTLLDSGISPLIESGDDWGISITFRFGMFLRGSYVKYYVTVNNTSYEYVNSLEKSPW